MIKFVVKDFFVGITEKKELLEWGISRREVVFANVKAIMKGSLEVKAYLKTEQEENQA